MTCVLGNEGVDILDVHAGFVLGSKSGPTTASHLVVARYSWCSEIGFFSVHYLIQYYICIPQYRGNWGNLFQKTHGRRICEGYLLPYFAIFFTIIYVYMYEDYVLT